MLTTGSSLSLCRITRELGGFQFTVSDNCLLSIYDNCFSDLSYGSC